MPKPPPSVREGKIVHLARMILAAEAMAKDLEFEDNVEYLGRELEAVHDELAKWREEHGKHIDYEPREG